MISIVNYFAEANLSLLFFLLVYGDTFLRRVVEILPRFGDKRRAVEISRRSKAIFRST